MKAAGRIVSGPENHPDRRSATSTASLTDLTPSPTAFEDLSMIVAATDVAVIEIQP